MFAQCEKVTFTGSVFVEVEFSPRMVWVRDMGFGDILQRQVERHESDKPSCGTGRFFFWRGCASLYHRGDAPGCLNPPVVHVGPFYSAPGLRGIGTDDPHARFLQRPGKVCQAISSACFGVVLMKYAMFTAIEGCRAFSLQFTVF